MPAFTAPSASASRKRKTNAGELPLTPTTASINFSGTSSAMPKLSSSSMHPFISSSVTFSFLHTPLHPSPTIAGVLGIQRTSLMHFPNESSICAIVFPAAMLMTIASFFIQSLISGMTLPNICGFTARISMSASDATSALLFRISIPYASLTALPVSCVLADPKMSAGFAMPFASIPSIIAFAIFPSPINPIFICSLFPFLINKYSLCAQNSLKPLSSCPLIFSFSSAFPCLIHKQRSRHRCI